MVLQIRSFQKIGNISEKLLPRSECAHAMAKGDIFSLRYLSPFSTLENPAHAKVNMFAAWKFIIIINLECLSLRAKKSSIEHLGFCFEVRLVLEYNLRPKNLSTNPFCGII